MDPRIKEDINGVWTAVMDREYLVLEDIDRSLGDNCGTLVDVGCGSRGILRKRGNRLAKFEPHSIGIDLDREALAHNSVLTHRACASCYSLPLKSNSVDVIVCRWVFEHLETPDKAMQEFARVLKKGGFLYLKTPNLWNYTMMLSWATPVRIHNLLRSVNGQHDNIPTFYRANTRRALTELASQAGFAVRRLESYSYSYMYYAFNKELFLTMKGISRLVRNITDKVQQTLFCVLEKVHDT